MSVFVDTSALYALLDRDDTSHQRAARVFPELLGAEPLVTHNYVLVETFAIVQHRLPVRALRTLSEDLIPVITTEWITTPLHADALSALLANGGRNPSFVDWVSFSLMRTLGVTSAFAFDDDFKRQGFALVA